jgi:DNA-binding transcriptional LysR family regulator
MPVISGFGALEKLPWERINDKIERRVLAGKHGMIVWWKIKAGAHAGAPLVAILPSDHRLAKQKAIDPQDFIGETYIGISNTPRVLRAIIGDYFKRRGIEIMPTLEIDNYAMAISLVASRRGMALLPISAESFLPWSVVSRPLKGEVPTIDLMIGYHKANASPILSTFLSRIEDLTTRLSGTARRARG